MVVCGRGVDTGGRRRRRPGPAAARPDAARVDASGEVDHTVEFGGDVPVRRIELGVLAFALPAVAVGYV